MSVVVVNCPPFSFPVNKTGCKLARPAYIPAVYPAGPEPIITNLWCFVSTFSEVKPRIESNFFEN